MNKQEKEYRELRIDWDGLFRCQECNHEFNKPNIKNPLKGLKCPKCKSEGCPPIGY